MTDASPRPFDAAPEARATLDPSAPADAPTEPEGVWPDRSRPAPQPPAEAAMPPTGPVPASPTLSDRLVALLEVLLCSGFPTQIALGVVLMAFGMRPYDDAGRLSASYVFTLSMADTAMVVGLAWSFLRWHGESPAAVVLGRTGRLREAVVALPVLLLVGFVVIAALLAVRAWAPWLHNVPQNPFQDLVSDRSSAVALGIVAVVAGGVREEVQRAFVLHRFARYLGGGWLGLVIFSLAFGAGHAMQGWDVAIATGLMGVVWGAVFLVRRSAIAPMISHALFNAGEVFRYTLYGL